MEALPLAVDAELRPHARGTRLRLHLHELYGRLAQAGPETVEVEWRHRDARGLVVRTTADLAESAAGTWSAETAVGLAAPTGLGAGTWDLRLRIRFREGVSREVTAHALTGAGLLRRRAVPSARHGVVLVQPYRTHSGALALRVAPGVRGVLSVARGRLRRLLH
ncbi:transferase [Streptomyces viridochromogenes DSM 40736]|uniref:Transferase n=1 Tax=Streptomyces viridochromogenes (strain DSM 40736 / JCM 4977 / BCRC 1201 / Tue 494) TaxID=591159 RepID=D9XDW6_STRVT|nr:transferase [Streptomyces viridochromogenes DSM 40736]